MYLLNDILSLWKNDYDPVNSLSTKLPKNRIAGIIDPKSNGKDNGIPRFLFRSLSSIDARSQSKIDAKLAIDLVPFYNSHAVKNIEFHFPSLETIKLIEKCKQFRKSLATLTQPLETTKQHTFAESHLKQNCDERKNFENCHQKKHKNIKSYSMRPKAQYANNTLAKRNYLSLSSLSSLNFRRNEFSAGNCNFQKCSSNKTTKPTEMSNLEHIFLPIDLKTDLCSQFYEFHELLGGGRFGKVFRCVDRLSGEQFAAKCLLCKKPNSCSVQHLNQQHVSSGFDAIDNYEAEPMNKEDVLTEIAIMAGLDHPNVVKLYDVYDSSDSVTLIMEYLGGGELFERVISDQSQITESDAVLYTQQIVEAVQFLHKNFILHLDLKPENIVCTNRSSHHIKIIDFGLARKFDPNEKLHVQWGTPEFMAPETLEFNIATPASDMWSVGVITYILLSGYSPFYGEDTNSTIKDVIKSQWNFNIFEFELVSDEAKDFISTLLVKNYRERLTATEALRHSWLTTPSSGIRKNKSNSKENNTVKGWFQHPEQYVSDEAGCAYPSKTLKNKFRKENSSVFQLLNWFKEKVNELKQEIPYSELIDLRYEDYDVVPIPA